MKRLAIVAGHLSVACLLTILFIALVPSVGAFGGSVLAGLAIALLFPMFAVPVLAVSQTFVYTTLRLSGPGWLPSYVLGGLIGAAYFALVGAFFPATLVATTIGLFIAGFFGSTCVLVLGHLTGVMDRRVLPDRKRSR